MLKFPAASCLLCCILCPGLASACGYSKSTCPDSNKDCHTECPEIISVIVEEAQQFQLPFDFQFDFKFGELRGLYRYSGQHNGASMYEKNDKLGYIYREELATNRTKKNWQIGVQKFDNGTGGLFAVKSSCPTNAPYWARLDTEKSTWFQTGVKMQDATGEYKINMWNKIVEKTPLWKKQLYLGFGLGIGIGGLFLFPIIYFTCRFGHPGPSTSSGPGYDRNTGTNTQTCTDHHMWDCDD